MSIDDTKFEESSGPFIDVDVVSKTTFAAAQNSVPVIRRITIRNPTEESYKDLRLTLSPQPAFCRSFLPWVDTWDTQKNLSYWLFAGR